MLVMRRMEEIGSNRGFSPFIHSFQGISSMVIPTEETGMVRFCSSDERRSSRFSCRFSLIARPPENKSILFSKFSVAGGSDYCPVAMSMGRRFWLLRICASRMLSLAIASKPSCAWTPSS